MTKNSKEQAQELLEVLMNSKEHNPAWALQEVLEKLREQFEYDIAGKWDTEHLIIDVNDILNIIEELKKL